MIVVAIIAILASVGANLYQQQSTKGRRSDGVVALTNASVEMERCYTRTGTYVGCGLANAASPKNYYTIAISSVAAETYTLTATDIAGTDTDCGNLTLDNAGTNGRSGTVPVARCWSE